MDSKDVIFEYIRKVSTIPLVVEDQTLNTPDRVVLKSSFYQKDGCFMCGRCCSNSFNTVFTQSGLNRILQSTEKDFSNPEFYGDFPLPYSNKSLLLDSLNRIEITVNGISRALYESPSLKPADIKVVLHNKPDASARCRWLRDDMPGVYRCGIHPIRSITCGIPHTRLNYNSRSNATFITTGQFGRNWKLGCKVEFGALDWKAVESKIFWLQALDESARDLGVTTVLPQVIEHVYSQETAIKNGKIPEDRAFYIKAPVKAKLF